MLKYAIFLALEYIYIYEEKGRLFGAKSMSFGVNSGVSGAKANWPGNGTGEMKKFRRPYKPKGN
jgi:hypothetical protein